MGGKIPTYSCGDHGDKVGDCSHKTLLSAVIDETCYCKGDLCNSVDATFPNEKSGAGSVHPAAAIAAATTVVAIAASIY